MSTQIGQTVPGHAHTPMVASVSGTPPVQMEKGLAELCCGDTGSQTPVTEEAPKPEVPGHLQQPVLPTLGASAPKAKGGNKPDMTRAHEFAAAIANPDSKKRHAQQEAMAGARQARTADRQASMASKNADRDARRQARADKRSARQASKAESRAARQETKANRVSTSDKLAAARTDRNATFAQARAKAPEGMFKHTKALAGDNYRPFKMSQRDEEEEHPD